MYTGLCSVQSSIEHSLERVIRQSAHLSLYHNIYNTWPCKVHRLIDRFAHYPPLDMCRSCSRRVKTEESVFSEMLKNLNSWTSLVSDSDCISWLNSVLSWSHWSLIHKTVKLIQSTSRAGPHAEVRTVATTSDFKYLRFDLIFRSTEDIELQIRPWAGGDQKSTHILNKNHTLLALCISLRGRG